MKCSLAYIIHEEQHPNLLFRGGDIIESSKPPESCPKCGRLFPLAKVGVSTHKRSLEAPCNRPDEHPRIGEHWHESGGARITFRLTEEMDKGPWQA